MSFRSKRNNKRNGGQKQKSPPKKPPPKVQRKHLGKVYRGETKYIDKDTKRTRYYAVTKEKPSGAVGVSKIKRIKIFDENGKNADGYLVEINHKAYNLPERSGVDREVFYRNLLTGELLSVRENNGVFETPEKFKLGSHDLHRVKKHTKGSSDKKKE